MVTNTITNRTVEGNRRVHYGVITGSNNGVHYFKTGLRQVEGIDIQVILSGAIARITYPTTFPALDTTSGHFRLDYDVTSGPVYWRAWGKS